MEGKEAMQGLELGHGGVSDYVILQDSEVLMHGEGGCVILGVVHVNKSLLFSIIVTLI